MSVSFREVILGTEAIEGHAGWSGVEPQAQETGMEQSTRFIGMDVHKDTIVVAVTATGDIGKATAYGTFPNTVAALERLVRRLRQAGDGP